MKANQAERDRGSQPGPRVCIVTTVHGPRDERIFHKQALSLAGAGYAVSMVAGWTPDQDAGPVRKLTLPPFRGKVDRFLRGSWLAFRLARADRAAVYHFHDPELLPLGLALKLCGKRVIYDVHEDYSQKVRSRRIPRALRGVAGTTVRTVEALCARTFDHIITADSHVAALFPAPKTTVIANYPPLRFVQSPATGHTGGLAGPLRLAYVGGMDRERGILQILEALDLLPDVPIEFHVAGDCSDVELLETIKRHPKTRYHGVLAWEEVNKLLAGTDVGMLTLQPVPAHRHHPGENIIKLWEYLGMGLPVIISDFPRLKALIEGIDAGLAVDPESPTAIAGAIRHFRDHPEVRTRMGNNGRAAVLKERNWEAEVVKLVGVYRRLLPTAG